ncbi:MAG: MBL fold metallo-hydrolase [Planctomycetaceae bacterium]|nr:MBL fold metallo-hydrolase [Planctomycetaceae bacterium]
MLISDFYIETIESEMFGQNAYLVYFDNKKDCFLVDAGFDADKIIRHIKKRDLNPAAILVTHGHLDHIAGNGDIKNEWPECKIYVGKDDEKKLVDPNGNLSANYGVPVTTPAADRTLDDGDEIMVADIPVGVLHLPGHSRGHVIYRIAGNDGVVMFVGDVIFMDSIGRYDFPDGNYSDLIDGIRDKILTQPPETILFPGHGPKTTVGRELRYNPFLQGDIC